MLLPIPMLLLLQAPATQPAPPAPVHPDKMICRKMDRTGSRLSSEKICLTKAQWDERERVAQREVKMLQANMGRCPRGGDGECPQ